MSTTAEFTGSGETGRQEVPCIAGTGIRIGVLAGLICLVTAGNSMAGSGTHTRGTDVPMTRAEECLNVIDGIGVKSCFTSLPDGRVLNFTHGKFRSSSDGGLRWSEPWTPTYSGKSPSIDGNLIVFKDGTLGLIGRVIPAPPPGLGPRPADREAREKWKIANRRAGAGTPDLQHIALWRSKDGGKTFSGPVRISPPEGHTVIANNDVVRRTSSGRILVPVYGQGHIYVYRSDDEGATWRRNEKIVQSFAEYDGKRIALDEDEPTVEEVAPGKLLMLMRTDTGRLYESRSNDNGETWSEGKPTSLMSMHSPAQLRRVPGTNDLLVVFNQGSIDEARRDLYRARLSTAISKDGGRTWTHFQNIESTLEGVHVAPTPLERDLPWIIRQLNPRNDELPGYPPKPPSIDLSKHGRSHGSFTYPCVLFHGKNLLIGHADLHWNTEGKVSAVGRVRVVPTTWIYGKR